MFLVVVISHIKKFMKRKRNNPSYRGTSTLHLSVISATSIQMLEPEGAPTLPHSTYISQPHALRATCVKKYHYNLVLLPIWSDMIAHVCMDLFLSFSGITISFHATIRRRWNEIDTGFRTIYFYTRSYCLQTRVMITV